jgi:type II secretory pathway component PulF
MGDQNWQYRAIDENMNVVEGEIHAKSFEDLALLLRQQHRLQILEATKVKDGKSINSKIQNLEQHISAPEAHKPQYIIKNRSSWWIRLLGIFIR